MRLASSERAVRKLAVSLGAAVVLGVMAGCGSAGKQPTIPVERSVGGQATAAQTGAASATAPTAPSAQSRESERIKATCAHRRALGSVETTRECERLERETGAALANANRSQAEGRKLTRELGAAHTSARLAEEARALKDSDAEANRQYRELHPPSHHYPAQARQAFLTGCKATERSPSVCHCWLDKVEARDSLAELEAITVAGLVNKASIPSGVKEDLERCEASGA
jgi:hypothetical protein